MRSPFRSITKRGFNVIDSIRMEGLRAALDEQGVDMQFVGVSSRRRFAYQGLEWAQQEYGGAFYAACEPLGEEFQYILERSSGGWVVRLLPEDDSIRAMSYVTLNPIEALEGATDRHRFISEMRTDNPNKDDAGVASLIKKEFGDSVSVRRLSRPGEYALDTLFRHDDGDHFVIHMKAADGGRGWILTDDGDCEWHYIGMAQGHIAEPLMRKIIGEASEIYSVEVAEGGALVARTALQESGLREAYADLTQAMKRVSVAGWAIRMASER